jgi:hypothetical protein
LAWDVPARSNAAPPQVRAILQRSPPRHFAHGHMSGVFKFVRWLPLWLTDWLLMRRFRIKPLAR